LSRRTQARPSRLFRQGEDDDLQISTLRDITAEEILRIKSVQLNYPYNFAEPPYPEIRWDLVDIVGHARFPMAKADACDKWECPNLTLDNFFRFIEARQISAPGYLSAVTAAKLIAYCLQIAESTSESMPTLRGVSDFDGEDLLSQIAQLQKTEMVGVEELSPWNHFLIAVKHPVVRWAVNNAVMNRWGARAYPVKGP
jgi:hypothetical protein